MPVYRNETEYFWGQIENNTEYYKFPEMYKLLNDRTCDEEFYHLCKNFIDIALNAPKFQNKENLTVEACFQYSDMDKAKRATQDFISKINYPGASTQALCSAPTSPLTALAFHSC